MTRVLALVLAVLEPASLALTASSGFSSLRDRGWPALLFLLFRLSVTGLGLMAGVALWQRRPGAIAIARAALALALLAVLIAYGTTLWPRRPPPGLAGPILVVQLAWYGGWLAWTLSRRTS